MTKYQIPVVESLRDELKEGERIMRKVVVALPVTGKEYDKFFGIVKEKCMGLDCELIPSNERTVLEAEVAEADAIIGNISPNLLPLAKNLSLLQLTSAGADAYVKHGIVRDEATICNCAGAFGTTVSEWMVAATFAIIRHFDKYYANQMKSVWKHEGKIISIEDSTVLVLGLGDIGGRYARAVKALGAHVIGLRKNYAPKAEYLDEQYTIEKLPEVIGRADIVAMVLPGGVQTEHIIDAAMLDRCKKGVYFVNAGRGNAIEPAALKVALKSGRVGGAALDVTEPEPLPQDDELWTMENVIITPHIAGWFYLERTLDNVANICAENIARWLKEEPLTHIVSRRAGY